MKKAKIKIEKIYKNEVDTKYGKKDKYTLIYKNFGFSGWGECPYKEGQIVEIEYDEATRYEGRNAVYFKLITKNQVTKMFEVIIEKLEHIENMLSMASGSGSAEYTEIEDKDIPVIEDEPNPKIIKKVPLAEGGEIDADDIPS